MDVRFTPLPMSLKWVQNNYRFLKAVTFLFLFSHFVFHKMVLFEVTYQTIHQNLVEAHWTLVYAIGECQPAVVHMWHYMCWNRNYTNQI